MTERCHSATSRPRGGRPNQPPWQNGDVGTSVAHRVAIRDRALELLADADDDALVWLRLCECGCFEPVNPQIVAARMLRARGESIKTVAATMGATYETAKSWMCKPDNARFILGHVAWTRLGPDAQEWSCERCGEPSGYYTPSKREVPRYCSRRTCMTEAGAGFYGYIAGRRHLYRERERRSSQRVRRQREEREAAERREREERSRDQDRIARIERERADQLEREKRQAAQWAATWREHARCRGIAVDVFYPHPGDRAGLQRALDLCAECPVVDYCLADALTDDQQYGVRGGASARERTRMR